VATRGEAMGSRYHARVALIYAIETGLTQEGAAPEEVSVSFAGARS
jgi:propanediol dehydratase large subunit